MLKIVPILIAAILFSSAILVQSTYAKVSKEQKAIDSAISKAADWKAICNVGIDTGFNQSLVKVFHKDVNRCNGQVTPIPTPTPTPTNGIPQSNTSKFVRIGVVGDVDNNAGLVTQLNLMKKYGVQFLIIVGDFGYSNGQGVIDKIVAAGFTKDTTVIILGNHDSCTLIKQFTQVSACFGDRHLGDKVDIIAIDGNSNFGCGTAQYNTIKSDIEGSNAMYKIPVIHQPFVTGPSDHAANGQESCYQTLFMDNGVDLVLQAHNHNYQRFFIDPIEYLVVGTGTHDSGSSMYPIASGAQFNGKTCQKCITGTNGVEILDLMKDTRTINGYFVSNADKIVDTMVIAK
jgi:hypothetical protein